MRYQINWENQALDQTAGFLGDDLAGFARLSCPSSGLRSGNSWSEPEEIVENPARRLHPCAAGHNVVKRASDLCIHGDRRSIVNDLWVKFSARWVDGAGLASRQWG